MISWSFSSLTRNVALGSNSTTNPGNSSNSSFDIKLLQVSPRRRRASERSGPNRTKGLCLTPDPLARSPRRRRFRLATARRRLESKAWRPGPSRGGPEPSPIRGKRESAAKDAGDGADLPETPNGARLSAWAGGHPVNVGQSGADHVSERYSHPRWNRLHDGCGRHRFLPRDRCVEARSRASGLGRDHHIDSTRLRSREGAEDAGTIAPDP